MKTKLINTVLISFLFIPLMSFTPEKPLRFAVITDVQYADKDPYNERVYREALNKLEDAVILINNESPDFTLSLGDLIDTGWENLETILPVFNSIQSEKYHVLGNHEFSGLSSEEKTKLTEKLSMPSDYYTFTREGWRFIILNSNDLSLYANPEGSHKYEYSKSVLSEMQREGMIHAREWNGGISKPQLQWLEIELSRAEREGMKVIVSGHMPVLPLNMNNLWNNDDLVRILEKHDCVKLYMAGHYHMGGYMEKEGIHYWTAKAMLDYPDQTAWSLVELYSDSIIIEGKGREPGRRLYITR